MRPESDVQMPLPPSNDACSSTAYSKAQAQVYDQRRFQSPGGQHIHRFERDLLLQALGLANPGARVLEVGCGTGRLLIEARSAGYRVDGVDLSPHMLDEIKAKLPPQSADCELMTGEAASVPKPDASYDFVYSIRLLNQTESPDYALKVVREMLRLVKPGGYVLVEFTNAFRPRWGKNRRDTTRLAPAAVRRCVRDAGGELVKYRGAFFTSMQAYNAVPGWMAPAVHRVDRTLSAMLPRLCSRCYALVRRKAAAE